MTTRYYPTFDDAAQAVERGEAAAMVSSPVDLALYMRAHPGFRLAGGFLKRTGELRRLTEKYQLPYLL